VKLAAAILFLALSIPLLILIYRGPREPSSSEPLDSRGPKPPPTERLNRGPREPSSSEPPDSRGPKPSPAERPNLQLTIKADKSEYVQLEPIRILAFVRNNDAKTIVIENRSPKPRHYVPYPVEITYHRVLKGGGLQKLDVAGLREVRKHGPPGVTIRGGEDFVGRYWRDNLFPPGTVTIKAVLRLLVEPYKGAEYQSGEIRLSIKPPEGADKAACDSILAQSRTPAGRIDYRSVGLIFNNGSHHGRPVHKHFIKLHGSSVHSHYTRHTMAKYIGEPNNRPLLQKILAAAPPSFPLRGECYWRLLECYKSQGQLAKMAALARQFRRESPAVLDPAISRRINELIKETE